MRKLFTLLPVLLFFALPVFAAEPAVISIETHQKHSLSNFMQLLEDPEGKLSIEQVTSPGFSARFIPLQADTRRYQPDINIHWLRFKVRNATTHDVNYLLETSNFDKIQLYIPSANNTYEVQDNGMMMPYRQRPVHTGRKTSFIFEVQAGQEMLLYLRVENYMPLSVQNKRTFNEYDNIFLQESVTAMESYQQTRLYQGMFVGILLIMACFNFFLYLFFQDRTFLLYVSFLFLLFLYWFTMYGFGLEVLWEDSPRWDNICAFLCATSQWMIFTWFSISFLNLKTYAPRWNYMLAGVSALYVLLLIGTLFDFWNADLLMLLILVTAALVLIVAVVVAWRRYRPAYYFLMANSIYLAAIIIEMLRIRNIIPGREILNYAPQIGTALQILLFSVGLADRINILRKKIAVQSAELSKQELEMKLMEKEQEAELLRLLSEQKDELERQVAERTAQLRQQHSELEQSHEEIITQRDYIEAKHTELESQKQQLESTYRNMMVLSSIGRDIISSLNAETIIQTVYESINYMMDASGFGIGIFNEAEQLIDFTGSMESGKRLPDYVHHISDENQFSVWCMKNKETIFINDIKTEYSRYISREPKVSAGELPLSLIYLPLQVEEKVIGVLTVQSFKQNAYQKNHLAILDTLANYIAIALANSVTYEHIKEAHQEINTKNNQIMDSLRYGEKIQRAILPRDEKLKQSIEEYFIIYRAKDVVSGDFYWFARLTEKSYIIAVLDCTGHGVPGAFMSMVGNTILLQVINEYHIHNPAHVLQELYEGITIALQQEATTNDDGMDVCLCLVEHLDREEKPVKITFAGAKRPLYYVEDGILNEIRGDRKSIGGIRGINKADEYNFTNQEVWVNKGTVLYLTSDGFVDQNNPKREKFGTRRLKQFMESSFPIPLKEQKEILLQKLAEHQHEEEQRDDITVLAVRV